MQSTLFVSPEERGLFQWLSGFPSTSLRRLKQINSSTGSSRHIILTVSYGLVDPNIRALNKMIIHLLLSRMKFEKNGDTRRIERVEKKMGELHTVVDLLTGVKRRPKNSHELCKSGKKYK